MDASPAAVGLMFQNPLFKLYSDHSENGGTLEMVIAEGERAFKGFGARNLDRGM